MNHRTISQESHILKEMLGFEARCKSFVIDPLYGPISFTKRESEVTKTQLFRRLKNIKQLGFISDLYPGANHSRFEHSIGTLYTSWELFKRFIINSSSHRTWLNGFDLDSFNRPSILQALRLSGLLHDIGHGPYSHTFETIFEDFRELKLLNHESLTLYMLSYGLDQKIRRSINAAVEGLRDIVDKSSDWRLFQKRREELSNAINNPILQRYILMILNNDIEFNDFTPQKSFTRLRKFLNELITSDVGSDRIDYLLRDTYFTGLGHRFNLYQILESVVGIFDRRKDQLRIAVDAEARNAVEFLLTTRYYHYRLIAHHPLNLDQEFRFRSRLKPFLRKGPSRALKLATLDEYKIQKHLSYSADDYSRVFTSDLRDIKVNHFRFFFYRIASDNVLRQKYIDIVKSNIVKATKKRNPSSGIKSQDIDIAIILEKPHTPLLHVYRENYRIEKDDAVEYHSILLHDWSDIIPALGRTYLLDSLFMVYAPKKLEAEVRTALSLSRKFYLSPLMFKRFLEENLQENSLHRLDLLLFCLYKATKKGSQPIQRIQNLFKEVRSFQRNLGIQPYSMEKCYDAENQISFDYCISIMNDLLILAVSEIIGIDLKYMTSRKEKGKTTWKAKYEISPIFDWVADPFLGLRRRDISNLERVLAYYPERIRRLVSYS